MLGHGQRAEGRGHIDALDGLRGIAALMVLVSHSANVGFLPRFLGQGFGQQGVALFYTLSGFLIFHLYLHRPLTAQEVRRYAVARGARVLPLFYAVFAVALVILLTTGHMLYGFSTSGQILGNALLIKGTGLLWSIPVEIQFYGLFILLWWAQTRSRLMMAVLVMLAVQVGIASTAGISDKTLPYWLHFFLIGGLASLWRERIRLPRGTLAVLLLLLPLALPEVRRGLGWPVAPITAIRSRRDIRCCCSLRC